MRERQTEKQKEKPKNKNNRNVPVPYSSSADAMREGVCRNNGSFSLAFYISFGRPRLQPIGGLLPASSRRSRLTCARKERHRTRLRPVRAS